MGVYIFMAVFMCVCVRLRVLAGRGNRGLGNLRHTDTALIIDSVPFFADIIRDLNQALLL